MFVFFITIFITNFFYLILGKLLFKKFFVEKSNAVEASILGIIIASAISLLINFFFPLNIINNSIVLILITIIFFLKKNYLKKKDFLFLIISSSICFFLILFDNEYRPDAVLYHIPYTQIINENKIILGLSNLHFRFGHISILQYLSALNYNIFTNNHGILIPLASIVSFFYVYFFNDILKLLRKKNSISLGKLFSLIIIIYISYKINRYSEFGNDAPAHLFLFYVISKFIYLKNYNLKEINFIYIISVFAFLNKIFFLFIFLLPSYLFFKNIKQYKKIVFSLPSLILFLWLIKNILVSGCIIYPIEKTCLTKLKWTDIETTKQVQIESEAWSKGWPQNKNSNLSIKEFVENFNWLEAWFSVHFKFILKTIIPFIIVITIIFFIISSEKFGKKFYLVQFEYQKKYLILIISILGTFSFFFKYPIYRYGYSYLILSIFVLYIFFFRKINTGNFFIVCKIVFILSIAAIISKQFVRIYNNNEIKNFIPKHIFINEENFKIKYESFKINENFFAYYSLNECAYGLAPCTNYKENINKINAEKINSYILLFNK